VIRFSLSALIDLSSPDKRKSPRSSEVAHKVPPASRSPMTRRSLFPPSHPISPFPLLLLILPRVLLCLSLSLFAASKAPSNNERVNFPSRPTRSPLPLPIPSPARGRPYFLVPSLFFFSSPPFFFCPNIPFSRYRSLANGTRLPFAFIHRDRAGHPARTSRDLCYPPLSPPLLIPRDRVGDTRERTGGARASERAGLF